MTPVGEPTSADVRTKVSSRGVAFLAERRGDFFGVIFFLAEPFFGDTLAAFDHGES